MRLVELTDTLAKTFLLHDRGANRIIW